MTHQWSSRHASRLLGRAAALTVAGQVLVMYAGAASYADDGLLGDPGPGVPAPAEQAVGQVVPTTPPPAPPPVEQPAEPAQQVAETVVQVTEPVQRAAEPVRQATEPVRQATEQVRQATEQVRETARAVGQAAEQAAEPVVRAARGAGGEPGGSAAPTTEAQRTTQAVGSPTVRPGGAASARIPETRPGGAGSARPAERVSEVWGTRVERVERADQAARRAHPADAAPRAAGTTGLPAHAVGDDPNDHSAQQDLAGLTTSLMKLYAGPAVPGGINAGLAGVLGPRTLLWTAPLLLGLLTGLWALVLARRCRTDATGTAVTLALPRR